MNPASGRCCHTARVLPRFEVVGRRRPVDLLAAGRSSVPVEPGGRPTPVGEPAPYVAVVADLDPRRPDAAPVALALESGRTRMTALLDETVSLRVEAGGGSVRHRSRRHARPRGPVGALGLALTGTHLTALSHEAGRWHARARVDLAAEHALDSRAEEWLAGLAAAVSGPAATARAGGFGQLGLRDVRLVSHADGGPVRDAGGGLLLSATSAGPGFFDTAHTSVWALQPASLELRHRADLFFRRPDRPGVYGDHATHLVRRNEHWLVATSTWGDFRPGRADASVAVTVAETDADLTTGRHLLDTRPLRLPTHGLRSVGVWDPHLVRDGGEWLVGYVSATRFFSFHPVLAAGPDLDRLELRGAARSRRATEGTTLVRIDGQWRVLASDGRDNDPGARGRYPVFDLTLSEVGVLDAPYPSNIPWPTVVPDGAGWLLVTFDGTRHGGGLPGYGTHGDVVVMRSGRQA